MTKLRGNTFHFKKFMVAHDQCAMKVNTDAVILGAYAAAQIEASQEICKTALDIGTGSGVISLMLAQKTPCEINAIEVNNEAYQQATSNFEKSPWAERLKAIEGCFLGYYRMEDKMKYDLIVSNPPFFIPQNFSKNNLQQVPGMNRAQARFDDSLPFNELILGAYKLLTPRGAFMVIIPYKRAVEFAALAVKEGFFIHRQLDIISVEKKAPKRVILSLRKFPDIFERSELILHSLDGERTEDFARLTQDYYL